MSTALDGAFEVAPHTYVVPAIYLKYNSDKVFNTDITNGVVAALDVVTIATGTKVILSGAKMAIRLWAAAELAGAIGNLGVMSVDEYAPDSDFAKAVDAYNLAMGAIGVKNLGKGLVAYGRNLDPSTIQLMRGGNSIKSTIFAQADEWAEATAKLTSTTSKQQKLIAQQEKNLQMLGWKRGVNGAGSVLRNIDDFIPSSGTQLIGNSNKTTTLLGRWSPDMQVIKGKMLPNEFNVGTEFGIVTSNNGGFNFLNIPDNLADAAGSNFFNLYNKPWLQQAIQRGDDIVLATRPTLKANFIDPITGNLLGMYAEELKFLVQQNYKPINLSASEWSTIKTWFP